MPITLFIRHTGKLLYTSGYVNKIIVVLTGLCGLCANKYECLYGSGTTLPNFTPICFETTESRSRRLF